jgi:effector-binding domain-containing protein
VDIDVVEVEHQRVAFVRRVVSMVEMRDFFDMVFGAVSEAVAASGGTIAGPPFGWYHGMPAETVDVAAGFPVVGIEPGAVDGTEVVVDDRTGGRAVVALHVGPFEALADSYGQVMSWMGERGLEPREDMWEEYLTDPRAEPDASRWQTRLVLPVRLA